MKTKSLEPKIVGITSVAFTTLDILVISVIAFFTSVAKENFQVMFDQQGRNLPAFTEFLISVPVWFYIICFAIIIAFLIIKEFWINSQSIALFINAITLVLSIVYFFIFIFILFLPLTYLYLSK